LPPAAKIQLPTRVRSSSHEATTTNRIHHSTVTFSDMNPRSTSEAKIAWPDPKPSMLLTFGVATVPVIIFVTPRLIPWRMKNVLSVIRKLGIPVRTTR